MNEVPESACHNARRFGQAAVLSVAVQKQRRASVTPNDVSGEMIERIGEGRPITYVVLDLYEEWVADSAFDPVMPYREVRTVGSGG